MKNPKVVVGFLCFRGQALRVIFLRLGSPTEAIVYKKATASWGIKQGRRSFGMNRISKVLRLSMALSMRK